MEPTIALIIVGFLMSTRLRTLVGSPSLVAGLGFVVTMLLLFYTRRFN